MMDNTVTGYTTRPLAQSSAQISAGKRAKTYSAIIACTDRTRLDAYQLRHASYVESGFMEPRPDRAFSDSFDGLRNSTTIVVYEEDRPVASVRVCFLSKRLRDAPAHKAFEHEVDLIVDNAPTSRKEVEVAEITRLVRSPSFANNQGLVFLLYKLAGHLVLGQDVQVILSSVRRNHVPFYQRLGFVEVAGPRPYPGLTCPMHLMQCSRPEYDRVRRGFALMDPEATPLDTFDGFTSGRLITIPLGNGR